MAYYPATTFVPQFFSDAGVPLSGGTISARLADGTTPTPMYIDDIGTSGGTSITLNARGEPSVSGNTVVIWLDSAIEYKFILADASAVSKWTIDDIASPLYQLGNTSSASQGDALIGVKRTLSGAIATNLHDFLDGSEIYLQRDFGCTADGVADDTSKIEAAIAAATNGDVIVFERGTYLISSLAQITKRLTFRGWNFGAVFIKTTSATATIFDVNGFFACFENLCFQSSVARTGGSYIWFNTSGSHCRVENVYMQNYINGIRVTAAAGVSLNRILMDNPAAGADAILFDGGNEHFLNQVEIGGDGVGNSGIRITNTGSLQFTDVNVIRHGADLLVNPATGQEVDNVYISNSFFDTADYGVLILPSGSGHVQNIRFNGCWTCSHSFQGVLISNVVGWTGRITGLTFVDHNSQGNAQEGLYIGAGIACKVVAGKFLGNTNSGIYVAANVDDFHILGARCGDETGTYAGNGRYGIEIAAGTSDHYTIQAGCDLRGNTLGALLNGASGTDRIIGHNLGHVTQAKGQASITAAATTVVVNHGLSGTPDLQDIRLVPLTSLGTSVTYWVSTNTSTQFTINVNTAPGVTISWGWEARITGD